MTLADIDALLAKRANLTTSAQIHHFQQRVLPGLAGQSVTLTVTVTDVKAVTWQDTPQFSVEAQQTDPAYQIEIYTTSEDALALNVGDTVTLQANMVGIRFGRKDTVALDGGVIVPE